LDIIYAKFIFLCRIEKQAEQEELEYQARRRRFLAEIRREKERLAEEETRINQELEETKQNLCRENAKVIERMKQEYQETLEDYTRRYQVGGTFVHKEVLMFESVIQKEIILSPQIFLNRLNWYKIQLILLG
jgi:hypothetical protein